MQRGCRHGPHGAAAVISFPADEHCRPKPLRPPVRPRQADSPRRGRQPRPRLLRRRRRSAVHPAGPRRPHRGRGRPLVHRLRHVVGAPHPRARAGRADPGPGRRREAGHELRGPDGGGGGAGDRGASAHAVARAGAVRELGHRGGDERAAARAGGDGPGPRRQVRRLLSRPRRRLSRAGGVGGHHPRRPHQPRGPEVGGGGHAGGALQRPRIGRTDPPPASRPGGRARRRAGGRQHGRRPPRGRGSWRGCGGCATSTA